MISRLLETKAMKDSQLMDTSGYYSDEIQRSARMIGDLKKKLKQQTLDAYLIFNIFPTTRVRELDKGPEVPGYVSMGANGSRKECGVGFYVRNTLRMGRAAHREKAVGLD